MSFDGLVEKIIQAGMKNGDFDDLDGSGQRIDLDGYFAVPDDLRAGYSILKNARVLPMEAEILKELHGLKEKLDSCKDESGKRDLRLRLNEATLKYNLMIEAFRRRRKTT